MSRRALSLGALAALIIGAVMFADPEVPAAAARPSSPGDPVPPSRDGEGFVAEQHPCLDEPTVTDACLAEDASMVDIEMTPHGRALWALGSIRQGEVLSADSF